MAKFKVGDRVRAVGETAIIERGREYTVAEATFYAPLHNVFVHTGTPHGVLNYTDDMFELVEPVAVAPAPTPIAATVNVDLEFVPFPQVGDAVLIPGVISAINQSPRGTNYNIVFETQNRRMSLHFLEEDFILDECGGDCDCPCANDNRPLPSDDTAKAFDAIGDWLRSLAVARAA